MELGAEGVGLFRTEFLFLDAQTAPTVEDQQAQYTELLQHFPGKKVVVRALDAGADKPLSFLNDAHEENPALGLRGLRALRAKIQILHDQLHGAEGRTGCHGRRPLGDGPDGGRRRGDAVLRRVRQGARAERRSA